VAQFSAVAGLAMVMPFLPLYVPQLGVTEPESVRMWSGLLFAAPFVMSALLQPFWGALGDRRGRKPMIVRAMLGLALANFVMGFAETAPQLLGLRLLQGTLSGFVAPSLALLASCTPIQRTGSALGTLQTAMVGGMTVGPLLGGVMAHYMGYRLIFFLTGASCFVGAMVVMALVRERFEKPPASERSRIRENMRLILHSPQLRFLLFLAVLVQFSIGVVGPSLSLYVEFLGVPSDLVAIMSGMVFGITGLTNATMAPVWGRWADRAGYRRILEYCLAGAALFYLPQAFVTDAYQLLVLRGGLGLFLGGVLPVSNSIVRRSTPDESRGGVFGILQSALLMGNVIGPLVGGVLGAYFGLRSVFLLTTCMFVIVVVWARAQPRLSALTPGDAG
jgi:MFS transporter, DHA1 family, multidrug resistance protein